MKTLKAIIFGLAFSLSVMSQTETLIKGEIESGGYGAPLCKIGQINGNTSTFLGVQGGWIVNHQFAFGGKGYMLVNPFDVDGLQNIVVGFLCGGPYFEYLLTPQKLVHLSFEGMIGPGMVYNDVGDYPLEHDPIDYTGKGCFVVEPGVNVNLNVTNKFRIGVGASYRFVSGINYDAGAPYQFADGENYKAISNNDLSGFSTQVVFKIGLF